MAATQRDKGQRFLKLHAREVAQRGTFDFLDATVNTSELNDLMAKRAEPAR